MILVTYLFAFLLGATFYLRKKYTSFLIVFFFILYQGFGFLPPSDIKSHDLALGLCILSAAIGYARNRAFFSTKGDIIAKVIYILLMYYTFITLATIIQGREFLTEAIKVWRVDLFYLSYFTFRSIPLKSTEKAFKPLLFFSALASIFYLLQYLGITGFLNESDRGISSFSFEASRFRNAPVLCVPLIFYLFYTKEKLRFKNIYVLLFLGVVVFAQGRGQMISVIASILVFQLLTKKYSQSIRIVGLLGLFFVLFSPFILSRFNSDKGQNGSFFDEIGKGLSMVNSNYVSKGDIEGTFTFRMFLAKERIEYLLQKPIFFFTGVGTIHEDSPNNRFRFDIGSAKWVNGNEVIQEIETNDIAFVTHFFRYGAIYILVYVPFLFLSLKRFFNKKDFSVVCIVGFLLLLKNIFQSLGGDYFSTFTQMSFLLLLLAQSNQIKNQ